MADGNFVYLVDILAKWAVAYKISLAGSSYQTTVFNGDFVDSVSVAQGKFYFIDLKSPRGLIWINRYDFQSPLEVDQKWSIPGNESEDLTIFAQVATDGKILAVTTRDRSIAFATVNLENGEIKNHRFSTDLNYNSSSKLILSDHTMYSITGGNLRTLADTESEYRFINFSTHLHSASVWKGVFYGFLVEFDPVKQTYNNTLVRMKAH